MKMIQNDWKKEYQYADNFQTAIMKAFEAAGYDELNKLKIIYPELFTSFMKYAESHP